MITIELRNSNGDLLNDIDAVDLAENLFTYIITANDITNGYYTYPLPQQNISDTYTIETSINATALETKQIVIAIDGSVQDDYIAYSTVFIDTDNDGRLDWTDGDNDGAWDTGEGEAWTTTDSQGRFSFTIDPNGAPIVAIGGVDTASGNPNNIVYKMYSNATNSVDGADLVVSPLATIIASIIDKNARDNGTYGEPVSQDDIISAVSTIATVFGITITNPVDLLTFDVVAAAQEVSSDFNEKLLTLNRQIGVVLGTTTALIDGALSTTNSDISGADNFGTGTAAATAAFANLILSKVESGETVELSSAADVESIMNDAMVEANNIIAETLSSDIYITATNPTDITLISNLIATFNEQVEILTDQNGAQDSTVINTLRAVTDSIIPVLSEAGAEAATDRGGDISLSDAITALNTTVNGNVTAYVTTQTDAVAAKTEEFLANDVNGIAGQLSKIVLQMPSLGVGDAIDTLTIKTTIYKYPEKDASLQLDKIISDKQLDLYTVNPVTKVVTQLSPEDDGYYHVDPAIAGYLYVKTVDAIDCYLDVQATNTNGDVVDEYNGTVYIHMNPAITVISPTLTITSISDDVGSITGNIAKNGTTNDTAPTITGSITIPTLVDGQSLPGTDGDNPSGNYKLAIYDGSTYLGIADVTGNTWSFTPPAFVVDGVKNLVARIVVGNDDSDFVTHFATAPYMITLDTDTPDPTINPTDGKLITGTAEAGATVTIKNEAGTETIGTAIADATGKWSLSLATQLTDTSKVKAMATDSVGNESGYSGLTTVEWNTPTTLVTLVSVNDNVAPVTGNFAAASHTNDATPTFSGTLSAPLAAGETLKVYNGDTLLGTATVNGTSWTYTPSALADGNYSVNAVVTNGSRDGKKSADFTFTVDTVTPTQLVTLTNVDDDVQGITGTVEASSTTNDSKPTFSGTLNNGLGEGEQVVVYDTNGGKTVQIGYATVSGTEWTFTPKSSLAEGLHKIELTIIDKAGNETAKQSAFTFTVDTVAGAPTINTNEPHMTTIAEESGTIVCTMNKPAGEATTLSIDTATGDGALFSIDQNGVVRAVGLDFESKSSYTFTVLATDSVGNSGKKSITVTATNVEEADAIVSIVPDTLEAVASPAAGETVEVTFTVYRSDDLGAAELAWSVTGGLSENDFADGVLPSGTVTFEEGETSAVITVEVPASLTAEKLRQLEVTIETDSDNYRVDTANASATVDVVDFSAVDTQGVRYTVSATNNASVLEGSDGDITAITYTIRRSSGNDAVGFRIDASGAALISGNDFCDESGNALDSLPSGNLEFIDDVATVTLYVRGDNAVGPDEQFTFALTGAPLGSKVFGLTSGKITNDDAYVSVYSEEIPNAASGEVTHKFIVTRSGNTDIEHTVTYSIVAIGENSTDMFDTEEVTLTFAPGETEKEISFTTTGDEVISGYKSFGIELSAGENVTLLNSEAMSTINPNVQDVEITTNIDRTLEGGAATFSYTVTRSGDVSEVLELPWHIVSAQENGASAADFAGGHFPSGVIRFEAGSESATVTFSSAQDTTLEGDEGFMLVLDDTSLPEYIRLINPSVEGVIVDDESAVGFNQSSVFSVVEGDSGSQDLVVTVSRIGFTGNESTVDWAITLQSGTGKAAASDLFAGQALSGTVTFKPGEASAVITIKINGDTTYESGLNETMSVTLSNPSAGTKLIGGTGASGVTYAGYGKSTTATIVNDDSLISVSSPTFSEVEGQGGTSKYLGLTIKRDGSTVGSDWVKWSLVSNGDSNSVNNDDLGQPNDAIGVFDSYYNSWIDFASLNGSQSAEGSVTLNRDGYIMVAYNRDWGFDNQPFDQFVLNNLSVQGGTLTSMGELSNFDMNDNENTGAISGTADSDGGSWDYTAYAIFKLDVTGANATVNFDVEQLGRYGIDTGKLSYAPEGTFSTSVGDMIEGNEGSNLLIPALQSSVKITALDLSAFVNEDSYAIEDVSYFNINSIYKGDLYYNEGTTDNPHWVQFWDHSNNVESYSVSIEEIQAGKLGYVGNIVELGVYAYDVDGSELSWNQFETGVYTSIFLDRFAGEYDLSSVSYVSFDSIPADNFYVNISETDTPVWANVWESEGYVSVADIVAGKLAYLGSSTDFKASLYDADENELGVKDNLTYHVLSIHELATDNDEGEYYTGYDIGAEEIRVYNDDDIDGTLYYNKGTSENPEWIEYNYYIDEYNDNSEYFPIQDAIDGKFAYIGDSVGLRIRFYTDGDYESTIYPYIEASGGGEAPSEIATQTGEVALDGSGYIWLRYDNNENSGNDGADMAWINNLHLIDPSGNATIEVVGQKVIKDGVAHEQELSGAGALQLDGIAIKNSPIVDENGDNLIAITTLQNGTMSTKSGIDIYVTDMNDQENDVTIDSAGLTTTTARSGMSTVTSLNAAEAKSVVYDEAYGSDTMADRTISLVHGNLTSLASNAEVVDPNILHTITLQKLVDMIGANDYLAQNEYELSDIHMLNLGYNDEEGGLIYINKGSVEAPAWTVWDGSDILAQDIQDGKLACSADGVFLYGAGFSMSDEIGYQNVIYQTLSFPNHTVTLEELSRAFDMSADDISSVSILQWELDWYTNENYDLYYNVGGVQNPNWVSFDDYYYSHDEEYPIVSRQDILDGKLAYNGDYVSFFANMDGGESYNYGDTIYAQMHTLTLGDLAKAFGITAGDIDYVELSSAYTDEEYSAYVNVGTKDTPEWVSMGYFTEEYGDLTAQDIMDGKVVYSGDYLNISEIYVYDKNDNTLVEYDNYESPVEINNARHVITLEDIATMYGDNFSADEIGSVYVSSSNVDDGLWYNSGTAENPDWDYYEGQTMSAQDIADGKFAYTGNYVGLCTYIYDKNNDYLVDDEWSDTLYPATPNPYIFDTVELHEASDGTVLRDEPAFMHSIAVAYGVEAEDTASVLDGTVTMDGELLTFTSTGDLSDRTITITGTVEGSEDPVTETIEAGPNGSTVVATTRFITVTSVELSTGANDAELSVGKSIVYDDTNTLFAKASVADSDGTITVVGLGADGQAKTVVYSNVLDGLTKSMGEFKEVFSIATSNMNNGNVEFSAVKGDGFVDVLLNGTRDEDGYITFAEPQRITIANEGGTNAQNEEFRITGVDAQGNTVVEMVSGIMNGGAYISEHYFAKVLKVEAGMIDGVSMPTLSIGTVGAPVVPEQAMSQYGGEVVVNDSVAVFETPSQITFSSDDDLTSRVYTITGTDANGATIVENVTGANGGIAISSHKFMSVSSITVDEGANGSVKVGYTTSGGMTDNFVITGSGTAADPFVGYSTNTTEESESDVLLFVNFNGSAPGSVKLSYDLAVQGATNSDTLYVEYSSNITSLLQGKAYFKDGESETTILIPIAGDDTKEGDEGMTLTLISGSTGTTVDSAHNTTEITVQNDDDIVTLDPTAKTFAEGNDDANRHKISFTITRQDDVTDKEVFWSIGSIGGEGQAEADDFAATSGSVTFAVGSKTTVIDVYLKADRIYEGVETFSLVLDTPLVGSGYSLNNAVANGTITEDDVGVSVVAADTTKNETDGSVTHTFTVSRVGDTTQASAINWAVSGTSDNGDIDAYVSDFGSAFPNGSLSFAANDTSSQTITITTTGDNEMTGDRNFAVNLTNGTNDTSDIYAPTAAGTVIEDDAVSLTIDQARHIENTGSEKTVTYTLTRVDGTHAATYNWNVLLQGDGVNAIANAEDFSAGGLPSGSVTFAEGATTATITLKIANDDILEADEAFKLHFAGASASVATAQDITSYIVNDIVGYGIDLKVDDVAVDTSVVEGSGTDKTVTVTFMRAGDSSQSATLTYSIVGTGAHLITADDFIGMDSLPSDLSVTFAAWESAITKTFVLKADSLKEETESFKIVLKDGSSAEVASKTVDVTSDDAGLVLEVDSGNVAEGSYASGATGAATYTTVTYTVYRSGDTTHSSDVKWRVKTADGITIDDFVGATDALGTNGGLPSGSVHFDANDAAMSKTFTLNVKKDWLYEGLTPENLVVELYDASVGTDITTTTATTTITDDDKEVGFVSYSVDGGSAVNGINAVVTEGDPSIVTMVTDEWVVLTYNILRTGNDRDGSQTVNWALSSAASEGVDAATVDWYSNFQWNSGDVVGYDDLSNKVTSGTLVFSDNNDNAKTITIKVHKDHYLENPEAFKISLTSNTPGLSVSSTTGVATGTITDDDIALVLSTDSATRVVHSEGQLDANDATVYTEYTWKIERKGAAEAVDLNWSIQGYNGIEAWYADSSSSDGYGWNRWVPASSADTTDFVSGYLSGTVSFTTDDNYKYLTVRVVGDAVVESTEAFRVVLTKPNNVDDITNLGNYSGDPMTSYFEGIILRDEGRFGIEQYELDISSIENFDNDEYSDIEDASDAKLEGNSGEVSHFFKIYRDFTDAGDATIEWRVQGRIPGNTSDANGAYGNNPFLWHNTGIAAVASDFASGQDTVAGGNSGFPSGVATIPDGQDYTIIEIKTSANVTAEDLKGYYIALSNPSKGSTLDAYQDDAVAYIANDDNPLFSIGQIIPENENEYGSKVVVEGDTLTYTVYRTGSTTYEAKVDWSVIYPDPISGGSTTDTNSTSNYTASASDFNTATLGGTLTFAAGQNSQTITLPIKNDGVKESWAEAFSVKLENARWSEGVPQNIKDAQTPAISKVAGTMESIIVDNSGATSVVSVSAVNNATDGYEGGLGGTNTITYTLTRTGDVTGAAQIGWTVRTPGNLGDYVSIDGNTTEVTYTAPNSGGVSYAAGLVSFGAGESSKTVTLTYSNDDVIETNENFVFTLIDGKTVLEDGYAEWMAPWYYGTGDDTTANANKSGITFLDGSGRIPDSDDMYIDSENYSATTTVKNDDGRIYVNNSYYSGSTQMGAHIYEGDSGDIIFTADISRYGRVDHDVTVAYQLVDSNNAVVASGTWALDGDADDNINGNGTVRYTKEFNLGAGNATVEADKTYTLKLSDISDTNIKFSQNPSWAGGSATQDVPVTVLNDDTVWSMTPGTLSQAESDDGVTQWTFTITRPNDGTSYSGAASVTYKIVSNGATYTIDTDDIVGGTGERTVNFAAGDYSETVTFNVTGDIIAERNESFNVELVSANHGVIHETNNKATYTIVNDDTTVEIHNATSVIEGDVDGAYLEFDVVRKGQIGNGSSTVDWAVQDGTATQTDDLTAGSDKTGTLSFDAGSTNISEAIADGYGEQTQHVKVYIKGDTTVEAHQNLSVSLSDSTDSDKIAAGKTIATGTIQNDESVITLSAGTAVMEGDATGQKFTITRSAVTGQSQTIDWAVTSDGSSHAVDGNDGVLVSGSVTFAPNELTKEIFVTSTADTTAELDEVFKLSIAVAEGTTGATISGNDYAYGVVLNDDAGTPTVSVNDSTVAITADSSVVEGDSGTQYVAFTLTRSGTLTYDASVDWHIEIAGKTAKADDFGGTLPSGTLIMPNGETTLTIQVPISVDSTFEGDETFTLVLDNPEPGLEISTGTAVGTITNDDALIGIASDVVVDENAGTATFTLNRSGDTTGTSSVAWTLTPSANVLGSGDIAANSLSGTAEFADGATTTTVVVYLTNDSISEGNEVFDLTLSEPSTGASLDDASTTKTLTITNDDQDVITYTVDATSKAEGDGEGWTTYTVTVNRENPTTTMSVDWSVLETSEEHLLPIEFKNGSGTVEFAVDQLEQTFVIEVKTDDIGDFDKYFSLSLTNPVVKIADVVDTVGAYVDTTDTTITVDNDDPAFSVAFSSDSYAEGSGTNSKLVTFVVKRDGDASGVASVTWTIGADENSDSPANLSDFGGYWPSGMTVFMDGETTKTIQVALAPDSTFEPSEGFTVTLSDLVSQTPGERIIVENDTAVITNDDIGVTVSGSDASVVEGNDGYDNPNSVYFDIVAEGVANKTVKVHFTLEGSGLSPADEYDFVFSSLDGAYNGDWYYDTDTNTGYVTVRTDGDGYASAQVYVDINGDLIAGNDETFRLRVTGVEGGTIAVGQDEITILNDDTAIASIVNTTVDMKEGNDGTKTYTFEITRSGSIVDSADLSYEIQGFGDNQADASDFVDGLPNGTVNFEAGSATATVTVTVASDIVFESDEGFIVIVGKDTPSETRLAATIQNDDSASLIFNGLVTAVKEGNNPEQPNSLSYEIIRNGDNSEAIEITYYIDGEEAGTISMDEGQSKVILNIPVEANVTPDENKTFDVSIHAAGFDDPAPITSSIIDDDAGVSIELVSAVSQDENSASYTYRVNRVGNNLGAEAITWMIAGLGINQTSADDFTSTTGTVNFTATDDTSDYQEFTITVANDTIVENNENFRVSISSDVEGQKILVPSVDATSINDDHATANADIIYGGNGVDILSGLAGNDTIHGGAGADVIFGGDGDDTIYAEGEDVIYAGLGDDTIVLDADDLPTLIDAGLGFDTLNVTGTLDLESLVGIVKSVEAIELNGTLNGVSYADVFAMNESHKLYISGADSDAVKLVNGTKMEGSATYREVTYDIYHVAADTGSNYVEVYIQQQII